MPVHRSPEHRLLLSPEEVSGERAPVASKLWATLAVVGSVLCLSSVLSIPTNNDVSLMQVVITQGAPVVGRTTVGRDGTRQATALRPSAGARSAVRVQATEGQGKASIETTESSLEMSTPPAAMPHTFAPVQEDVSVMSRVWPATLLMGLVAMVAGAWKFKSSQEKLAMAAISTPRNANFAKLSAGYLFPMIAKKRNAYIEANPDVKVISLGIGDTTEPLPEKISKAMSDYSNGLGTRDGYEGYDPKSEGTIKELIAKNLYKDMVSADEVFVSDGSKCDIGRLQLLFGTEATVAVQDPSYPVYVDSSVILGRSGLVDDETKQYDGITYMACNPANGFFPDFTLAEKNDIIYFCNPNNPTGACATRAQLQSLVEFAKSRGKVIVYDSAYSQFIQDPDLPKSIYEIDGARECCIETSSFSKLAGFTGVRCGWVVVPSDMKFSDGTPVKQDFARIMSTLFNGAASVSQAGAIAVLNNLEEVQSTVDYYMENARLVRETFDELGFEYYGGENAPYVFVSFPGKDSWEVFEEILNNCSVVTTPGSGFGPAGEGFVRISAFGMRENVIEACARFRKEFSK